MSHLVEDRRYLLIPGNVVEVILADSTSYKIIKGSYTDEDDPAIVGPKGQVSFVITERSVVGEQKRLVLTYTHFIMALKYDIHEEL